MAQSTPNGTGLTAQYFNDTGNGTRFTTLALTRTDAQVNFAWGTGAPAPEVQADNFSVRWTGRILSPVTGYYNFAITNDAGARLWVNNQLVINDWSGHTTTTTATALPMTLIQGEAYDIKVEYFDTTGNATVQLLWTYPGQAQQAIPQQWLFPGVVTPPPTGGGGTGLTGQYFNDTGNGVRFTTLALTRTDATVDFSWGNAAPAAAVQADNYSTRWTGQVQAPVSGSYTFYTVSDDGVRLWVNNQLLVDNWTDHGTTTNTGSAIALTAGTKYDVKMEYYERGGGAVARLLWSYPGQAQVVVPQANLFPTSGGGGDTTQPTVSVTAPTAGQTVSGTTTVSATASDNVGVVGVQFKLDGANLGSEDTASPYSVSWTTTSATNGAHTLTAVARDAAGNTRTSTAVSVTVNNQVADTTKPTVSITAPSAGQTVSSTINVTANASDNVGVVGVQFKLDGANLGAEDTASPYSVSWNTASVANGAHTLTAVARDAAANSTTSTAVSVTVNNQAADTTPPTVSVTAPTAGQTLTGTVTMTANASDNVGVAGVQFTVDGNNVGSEDTSAPYSVSVDTTLIANGSHTVRAIARDAANNRTTSGAVTVTVTNQAPTGPTFYVSPTGTAGGNGSINSPWDLATALTRSSSVIPPGSTVYLRGGTYRGNFRSYLTGQAGNPVTVRQYPGERAIIDGAGVTLTNTLAIEGQWAIYRDFEVTNTDTNRTVARPTGVDLYGPNVKLVNLVVHDNGNGIGFWEFARDSEVYGCVVYNNGIVSPTSGRGAGHGMYIQNDAGTKKISDVVAVNNFGFGLHAYGEGGRANGLTFENNASFNNGSQVSRGTDDRFPNLLVGTTTNGVNGLHIVGNYLYHQQGSEPSANLTLGYGSTNNDVELRDNWIVGGDHQVTMSKWATATVVNNTFFCMNDGGTGEYMTNVSLASGQSASGYTWNGNTYYDAVAPGTPVDFGWAGQYRTFANWRTATGFDSTSTYTLGRPSGVNVFVHPNDYQQGRANVIVYNWSGATTVGVDLSGVLTVGQSYEIRSTQDYLGAPVLTGTYNGQPVQLPLNNTTVVRATGFDYTPTSTAPEFNVYVVLPR